jgi:hypothetical protein
MDALNHHGMRTVPDYCPTSAVPQPKMEINTNTNNPHSPRRASLGDKKAKKQLTLPDGANPYSAHVMVIKQRNNSHFLMELTLTPHTSW